VSYHGEKQLLDQIDDLRDQIRAVHSARCGCELYDAEEMLECLARPGGPFYDDTRERAFNAWTAARRAERAAAERYWSLCRAEI